MRLIHVFKKLGIDCGYYTTEENRKADCLRVRHSDHKSMKHVKKRRKQLRAINKGFADKNELEEGETSGYGQFYLVFISNMRSFVLAFCIFAFLSISDLPERINFERK